jgi:hypothetical protein
MALLDFFSTTFLIHLAITVLVVGTVSIYFIQKINVQNHKINSMLELVTTMAEELKRTQALLTIGSSVPISFGNNYPDPTNNTAFSGIIQLGEKKDLINVSDDEDDDYEDEDDDEDDEDEYDDEDDEDDDEDEDEDEDDDDEELDDIKTINIGETTENVLDNTKNKEKNNDDTTDLEEITQEVFTKEINLEDLEGEGAKSIDILDYKKLSLTKLKSILVEKGIVTDASKLKKNEILKLLEVE